MTEVIQWEYGVLGIPVTADMVASLNQAGDDGWEACWVVGVDQASQTVRIVAKRHKRKITLSTDVNGALRQ